MRILSIETSCDETALALVDAKGTEAPSFKVHANLVSSQIPIHRPFGGVVPHLAKREHLKNLPLLLEELARHDVKTTKRLVAPEDYIVAMMKRVDAVAVTVGPGLEPALWTGINAAQDLARRFGKPLIGANHLEGHLYSFLLAAPTRTTKKKTIINLPAIGLIISGGHTMLLEMSSLTSWKKIGETRDDAVGEAFDKVARMLSLPYPGGPEIEQAAKQGNPAAIAFPRPMLDQQNFDFSFSGLKTAVLYHIKDLETHANPDTPFILDEAVRNDIAASFQTAVIETIIAKTMRAARQYHARSIIIGGGVAANKTLRSIFEKACEQEKLIFITPARDAITDNAAMIATAAYMNTLTHTTRPIVAQSNLNL
ncbi:MAG: tRNA (adenosine(37)-N6)-threonylcarbamoyltransferase complex transferase subunit TsaD [Patescibacteria group bacterium]|nr:tRNA (adenosine(37)-N6)-threonylcarbamoyltransferase complex transferase subunit TsaD [Patescibacteria group bacterium]MDE2438008.1 tRNA (adenosine(37)-N6)-threonylcarbamoyltransferase complex transferase subunit TsaD [Patescibacteria group bacterium]